MSTFYPKNVSSQRFTKNVDNTEPLIPVFYNVNIFTKLMFKTLQVVKNFNERLTTVIKYVKL